MKIGGNDVFEWWGILYVAMYDGTMWFYDEAKKEWVMVICLEEKKK